MLVEYSCRCIAAAHKGKGSFSIPQWLLTLKDVVVRKVALFLLGEELSPVNRR